MEMVHKASILMVPPLSLPVISTSSKFKPLPPHPRPARCFRLERRVGMEVDSDLPLSADNEAERKEHKDIWKLFTEAQQNILHLNKQRIMALKELDQLKREKFSLLDKIELLQANELHNTNRVAYSSCGDYLHKFTLCQSKKVLTVPNLLTCSSPSTGMLAPSIFMIDRLSISSDLLLRVDSMVLTGMVGNKEASELRRLVMDSRISIVDNFLKIMHKNDSELLDEMRNFSNISKKKGFHIVHICAEMEPVVSVGRLATYVTGLSCALQRKGNVVEVILPKYACLKADGVKGLRVVEAEFYSFFNGQLHANRIWNGVVYGIGVTFIEPVYYSSFFSGERVYGYLNDFERFAYFSQASLDYIVKSGKQADVIHVHNWETSIVGPLFWEVFVNQGLESTRILLTCQGFSSQCLELPEKLALCGLDPSRLHRHDRLQDNNKTHLVNLLKGGIVYSNEVIVISSSQTNSHIVGNSSYGMQHTLTIHRDKVLIAPYGFDKSIWDPSSDKFLPQRYSAEDMKGKSVCKIFLQQHLGLEKHASTILVGCILTEASDIDVESLKTLIWMACRKGVQFVFLLFQHNPGISSELESLREELKDGNGNVTFIDEFDEPLLHLMFAGCDIMLCTTFDDPVLQVPLKAMKYGAQLVSVNSGNGRLRDMQEHDLGSTEVSQCISKVFANVTLSQAIDDIRQNPKEWNRKMRHCMERDFSWDGECCNVHISAYDASLKISQGEGFLLLASLFPL